MRRRLSLRHRFAAALAGLALLAVPARGAACPMTASVPETAVSQGAAHHAHGAADHAHGAADHAHEAAHHVQDEPASAPAGSQHEVCTDLAHCAAAVMPAATESSVTEVAVRDVRAQAPLTAPLSVEHSLDPPPPKA